MPWWLSFAFPDNYLVMIRLDFIAASCYHIDMGASLALT